MAVLTGTMSPAIEISRGKADYVTFVSRSARKVLGSSVNLLVQGLSAKDDKVGYRYYEVTESQYNALDVPVNGSGAEVEPIFAYCRSQLASGSINAAKYALVATRNADLLSTHARALVTSDVAAFSAAIETALFDQTPYTLSENYGLNSSGPSVLKVLGVLNEHSSSLELDLHSLMAIYHRRTVKRIPGIRKDDGTVELPTVESKPRNQGNPWVQVRSFDLNRNTASANILVASPIDLFETATGSRVKVAGVDLDGLSSFNNYTIVGDGQLTVRNLTFRTTDKRAFKALHDLGVVTGKYVPEAPFTIDLSSLPLVEYDQEFDSVGLDTMSRLARLTVVSKILNSLTKGESTIYTPEQVAELKKYYLSPALYFSPPSTNDYVKLEDALASGKVDTRLSYKIDFGMTDLTSMTKLQSGNAYLQRRFTLERDGKALEKPTLDQVLVAGTVVGLKKLTAATKLGVVDEISFPIYQGFLGVGDTKEIKAVLALAGVPSTFLNDIRSTDRDVVVAAVDEARQKVDHAIESIYEQIRPLAFYIGATGLVPDSLGAKPMTAEQFENAYPNTKLSKDEKEEGSFFLLPSGTLLTVFVSGEYYSTSN